MPGTPQPPAHQDRGLQVIQRRQEPGSTGMMRRAALDRNQAGQERPGRAPPLSKHPSVSFPCSGILDHGKALPTLKEKTAPSRMWSGQSHISRKENAARQPQAEERRPQRPLSIPTPSLPQHFPVVGKTPAIHHREETAAKFIVPGLLPKVRGLPPSACVTLGLYSQCTQRNQMGPTE